MIAILGGGITGLVAAFKLKKAGKEFILFEREPTLGGKIKTIIKDGYVCEQGPNTVLINNPEIKNLIEELNLSKDLIFPDELAVKNRFVLKNNRLEPFPNSLSKSLSSKLLGFSTLISIIKERFKKPGHIEKEESLGDFCRRRFGNQITEDFIIPFVTGIYAGNIEKMSSNYVLPFLKEAEEKHGSIMKGMMAFMKEKKTEAEKYNLPKQKIFTFKGGLEFLVKRLEAAIGQENIIHADINAIENLERRYQIHYTENSKIKTLKVDKVVSTLPANGLSNLIDNINNKLSNQLKQINSVPAVVIHLGFEKKDIGFKKPAFGILSKKDEKAPFLGVLFNSRFFPHTSNEKNELITVICGGYKEPDLVNKSDEIIKENILNSISELLNISAEPNFVSIKRWKKGIPQYELGYREIEKSIAGFEKANPNFQIGGNFYNGISVSDCVKNGFNLASKFS